MNDAITIRQARKERRRRAAAPREDEEQELKIVGTLGEALEGWRSATPTRVTSPRGTQGRQDFHLEATFDRNALVEDARQLERSNAVAEGLLSRSVENIVGTGWPLQALTASPSWNTRTEGMWKEWGALKADIRGMSTWNQLLQLHQRAKMRDGDSFVLFLDNADDSIQSIESDQVATPFFLRRRLVDGIELDMHGRPTSYHVITDPDPLQTNVRLQKSTEIPAEFICPLSARQRNGQTRGLTKFANSFWLLEQLDGHVKASTVAARMAACVGLVLHKARKSKGLPRQADGSGVNRRTMRMEPGFMLEMEREDKVTQVDPAKPVGALTDTILILARLAGIPFGLPLEVSLMYWQKSNMSQARGALLQAHNVWQCEQADLAVFASRQYRWWLIRQMEAGRIKVRSDALDHRWLPPAWKYLNPKEEILADLARVDANTMTLGEITRRDGRELADVVKIRAQETALIEAAGLDQARSTLTRDPVAELTALGSDEKNEGHGAGQ